MSRQTLKRSISGTMISLNDSIVQQDLSSVFKWIDDNDFLSTNDIYSKSIGLYFCLTTKRLIHLLFMNLRRRSLTTTWQDLLFQERRLLKPNTSSIEKCFIINRLIAEYDRNSQSFERHIHELYEEIKMRLKCQVMTSEWTFEKFYEEVSNRQRLQSQRRLFYISNEDANQPHNLLVLQQVANTLCNRMFGSNQTSNYGDLKYFLEHIFLIVCQPSIAECVAAAKYEKNKDNSYSAKINTRILCLIDPNIIDTYFTLNKVEVTLYLFEREADTNGERQDQLDWKQKEVTDADGNLTNFYYFDLESIYLKKIDKQNSRPSYSAKLCQLQFDIPIELKQMNHVENITLISQTFGLCSHAQYYPEFIAKVLLHEVNQTNNDSMIQSDLLCNFVQRYHTCISGVEPKPHTIQFITDILRDVYEQRKSIPNVTSFSIYEDTLSKLISQMEMFIDYPFLSMMYHDGLILGICNNTLDKQLNGSRENPHILIRFNTLSSHRPTDQASVRFIVHNGELTRATFHAKAFIDEMTQMIRESTSDVAKQIKLLFQTENQSFFDFSLYFHEILQRLSNSILPIQDHYEPLIPVLWNMMRVEKNNSESEQQAYSSPSNIETRSDDSSQSNAECTNFLVRQFVDGLFEFLVKTPTNDCISTITSHLLATSTVFPDLTNENLEEQKTFLSRLLIDSFSDKIDSN